MLIHMILFYLSVSPEESTPQKTVNGFLNELLRDYL